MKSEQLSSECVASLCQVVKIRENNIMIGHILE